MNALTLFHGWDEYTPMIRRTRIQELEDMLLDAAEMMPQVETPVVETLCNGVYVREMSIPQGTVITGKIHKHDQINILIKGTIIVATENALVELTAPQTLIASGGTKKAAYAITDCIWVETFATDKETSQEIEKEIVVDSYEELEQHRRDLLCHSE